MPIINYLSDLHLESGKLSWDVPDCADVVVIAGDLWNGNSGLNWLDEFAQTTNKPIIYVPGNHCFWDNDIKLWPVFAKKFCDNIGVYFLYNDEIEINGMVYLGTTLWTDFNSLGNQPLKMAQAQAVMNDYRWIKSGSTLVTPEEILAEHVLARQWLASKLVLHRDRTTCVVTHHAPTKRSLSASKQESKYAPFYATDMLDFVMDHQPDVWIHGHLHDTVQYFINDTLVVSNPRGHAGSQIHYNSEFTELKLLEF
jgi:Icc-related predicted phosphoesterase